VELVEYQTREDVPLTPLQVTALRSAGVAVIPSERGTGIYALTPSSTVGSLQVDGRQFHLRPKVGIRRLLFLLSFSSDASWVKPWLTWIDDDASLLDAMATAYAHAVDDALSRGVRRGYLRRSEAASTVRGRIDVARQLRRHHGRMLPIEIDYDDYTIDTDANRMLLAATDRLSSLRIRDPRARSRLVRTVVRLEGVTPTRYTREIPRIQLTRLDEHYRLALSLARIILAGRSLELRDGTAPSDSILFDMNVVFEDFVVTALREELGLDGHSFPQNRRGQRLELDVAQRVNLEPDLSWWVRGRCVFIGDVKYKRVQAAGIKHPDLYQLLAYTMAAGLRHGLLIYAKGEEPNALHTVRNSGADLDVRTLDLEADLAALQSQISELASLIRWTGARHSPVST
jgi:5-methylcytosine-specific restriction enzyme subunit McrC